MIDIILRSYQRMCDAVICFWKPHIPKYADEREMNKLCPSKQAHYCQGMTTSSTKYNQYKTLKNISGDRLYLEVRLDYLKDTRMYIVMGMAEFRLCFPENCK